MAYNKNLIISKYKTLDNSKNLSNRFEKERFLLNKWLKPEARVLYILLISSKFMRNVKLISKKVD